MEAVRNLVGWLQQKPEAVTSGSLVHAPDVNAEITTFYFDGPAQEDWPGLARIGSAYTLAFRGGMVWQAAAGA